MLLRRVEHICLETMTWRTWDRRQASFTIALSGNIGSCIILGTSSVTSLYVVKNWPCFMFLLYLWILFIWNGISNGFPKWLKTWMVIGYLGNLFCRDSMTYRVYQSHLRTFAMKSRRPCSIYLNCKFYLLPNMSISFTIPLITLFLNVLCPGSNIQDKNGKGWKEKKI